MERQKIMSSKKFTIEEIEKILNEVFMGYSELYVRGGMTFTEFSIIENVIKRTKEEFGLQTEREQNDKEDKK